MSRAARIRWIFIGLFFGLWAALASRYPLLWGIFGTLGNVELAIGIWLAFGYSALDAFYIACAFGNGECLFWNFVIGKKVSEEKERLKSMYASEKEHAKKSGIAYYAQALLAYVLERLNLELYRTHWIYRFIAVVRRRPALGSLAVYIGYVLLTIICVVPVAIFPAMILVHTAKIRYGIIPVLIGNTLKMTFWAFGFWPTAFSLFSFLWG